MYLDSTAQLFKSANLPIYMYEHCISIVKKVAIYKRKAVRGSNQFSIIYQLRLGENTSTLASTLNLLAPLSLIKRICYTIFR